MELPLELVTTGGEIDVETTPDHSATRLLLTTTHRVSRQAVTQELHVHQVQQLAGALLAWLAENGHDLPELDLPDLELDEDEDEAQSATARVLPEHTR